MTYFKIFSILVVLSLSCKKEVHPFKQFEGKWKPVSFTHYSGVKTFPADNKISVSPDAKTISYTLLTNKDSMIFKTTTYQLRYNINTYLQDYAVLVIDEKYEGLDSNGRVILAINNYNTVNLIEGQSYYGYPESNKNVLKDRIKTYDYSTMGMRYEIKGSELQRLE